jgi:FkbM family methyltransferase
MFLIRSAARQLSFVLNKYPKLKILLKNVFLLLPQNLRGEQMVHDHLVSLHKQYGPQSFLLIGANDGITDDHLAPFIFRHHWQGTAVEPVPQYFKEYESNYRKFPVRCLNIAIHESAKSLTFYYLEDSQDQPLPAYAKGIGSFNQNQVRSVACEIPNSERYFRSIEVPCLCFQTLMNQTKMHNIDVIIIDTEGYDAAIILQIDLVKWRPKTVVFEHKLLSKDALLSALQHLEKAGYRYKQDRTDTLAWK